MASFVVHHTAGMHFLDELEKENIKISEENRNDFLLSNLIVDSIDKNSSLDKQTQKIATHFRGDDDRDKVIQYPDLNLFLNKYAAYLEAGDFKTLGYLFHLYTDCKFFNQLFRDSFTFLDKDHKPTIYASQVAFVRLHKNGNVINNKDFWTHNTDTSIYDDYTTINKIVLEHFGYGFDYEALKSAGSSFTDIPISEVNPKNIFAVLDQTKAFIAESYATDNDLKVFKIEDILDFIPSVVSEFSEDFSDVLKNYKSNKTLTKKKN